MARWQKFKGYARRGARTYRRSYGGIGFGMNIGFIVGLVAGVFGLLDTVIPAQVRTVLMAFAVAPIRGKGVINQAKFFCQGFVLGIILRPYLGSVTGIFGTGSTDSGNVI